jgi:hypothetical protein
MVDTLFTVHNDYVTPKLWHEDRQLTGLVQEAGPHHQPAPAASAPSDPAALRRREIDRRKATADALAAAVRARHAEAVAAEEVGEGVRAQRWETGWVMAIGRQRMTGLTDSERAAIDWFLDAEELVEAMEVVYAERETLLGEAALAELDRRLAVETDADELAWLTERRALLAAVHAARDQVKSLPEDEQHYLAFINVPNSLGMAILVAETPDEALDGIERAADAHLAAATGEDARAIEMRLTELRQLRAQGPAAVQALLDAAEATADRLGETLVVWVNAPDWAASEAFLRQHADELLTEDGETVVALLQLTNRYVQDVDIHAHLLHACREHGIDAAYAQLHVDLVADELEEAGVLADDPLTQAVVAYLRAVDDAAARAVLAAQATLLSSPAARAVMEMFLDAARASGDAAVTERVARRMVLLGASLV